MAASKGRNEGMHVQPEFKCEAIPNPAPFIKPAPKNVEGTSEKGRDETKKDTTDSLKNPPEKAAG